MSTFTLNTVFTDGDIALAARIHRNTDNPLVRQPAALVTGSWLTVKEQMADAYAIRLAERGYTAMTFDFAGFGASGGGLRQCELPTRKISNLFAATRFLSGLSFTAPGGPGILAICASAQYAMSAIAAGLPVTSFVSVAGWFHDSKSVAGFYGGEDGIRTRLEVADKAMRRYVADGTVATAPAYGYQDMRAGMFIEMDYYANRARGAVPTWRNEMGELSWAHWLTFDGLSAAKHLRTPSLFVHSDSAVFPDHIRQIADQAPAARVVWTEGEQTDFYDQEPQMTVAIETADRHLAATLGARRSSPGR